MRRKSFLIAFFATIVRYYDYGLFGLSAAKLSEIYFAPSSEEGQLLRFFAVFTLAVYMRPVGSLIFGFIGDHYGRVTSVKIAGVVSAFSTMCIGILPEFSVIGWMSTLLLLLARMLFLVSLAGEVDAIKVYIAEKVSRSKRHIALGIVSSCSQVGALIAAFTYHFTANLGGEFWRIGFIAGGILGLLVIFLQQNFQESEEFLRQKEESKEIFNKRVGHIIYERKLSFLIAVLINGGIGGIYNFLVIFFSTFAVKIIGLMPSEEAQIITIKMIITYALFSILSGILADRLRAPKRQLLIALVTSLVLSLFMPLVVTKVSYFLMLITGMAPLYVVPLQVLVQGLFPTSVRMRMVSLSHSLGSMIFSSSAPFLCTLIWQYTESMRLVFGFCSLLMVILFTSAMVIFTLQTHHIRT